MTEIEKAERRREYMHKYRLRHRERIRQLQHWWYVEHREQRLVYQRRWYAEHRTRWCSPLKHDAQAAERS